MTVQEKGPKFIRGRGEKGLATAPGFKEMLTQEGVTIAQILEVLQNADRKFNHIKNPNPSAQDGAIKVEFLGAKFKQNLLSSQQRDKVLKESYLYKITVGDQKFFLKIVPRFTHAEWQKTDGFAEAVALNNLSKEELKKLGKVRIVDFVLGFTGIDRQYFVSKWEDLPVAEEYHIQLLRQKRTEEADRLYDRIHKLIKLLEKDFSDVGAHNMFYDEEKDEIVLFDIFHRITPLEEA